MEILRFKSYRTFGGCGIKHTDHKAPPKKVFVAVLLGMEPEAISSMSDYLDVEESILEAATNILRIRSEFTVSQEKLKRPKKRGGRVPP